MTAQDWQERMARAVAEADQVHALLRDDDCLHGMIVVLVAGLQGFIEAAPARGMNRQQVYGFIAGLLLAALDDLLPAEDQ